MIMAGLHDTLRMLASRYETAAFLDGDPSWWMHQVEGTDNQEAAAFVASALSYGSRKQFMPKIGAVVEMAGGDVDRWLRSGLYKAHFGSADTACYYRLYSRAVMRRFFDAYSGLMDEYGSMRNYVGTSADGTGIGAVKAICRWFTEHGDGVVVPRDAKSACKRVCMFLRWMVRDHSPVDLGLWSDIIDRRTLIMPLDTHVLGEAVGLGMLKSRTATMAAAVRLTEVMAEVFPGDPLRGDFALFGYGVDGNGK